MRRGRRTSPGSSHGARSRAEKKRRRKLDDKMRVERVVGRAELERGHGREQRFLEAGPAELISREEGRRARTRHRAVGRKLWTRRNVYVHSIRSNSLFKTSF